MTYTPGATITLEFVAFDGATGLYPQCVVRNLDTDEIIATVNLDDAGGGRYRGTCQVPNNSNGGLGYYISQTTVIYDDSGHTSANANYSIASVLHQVIDAVVPNVGAGGGMGSRVDYATISNIVEDIIKSTLKVSITELKKLLADNKAQMDEIQSFNKNFMTLLEKQISVSFAKLPIATLEKTINGKMTLMEGSNKSAIDSFNTNMTKMMKDCIDGCRMSYMASERILEKISKTLELQSKSMALLISNIKINTKQSDIIISDLGNIKNEINKAFEEMVFKFTPFNK